MHPADDQPLRIAFLAYRGKPHVGGQGVYTRHLTKALVDLGHHVEVLGGQPFPVLDERVPLVELPSLDIYNDYFPMRMPGIWELKRWPTGSRSRRSRRARSPSRWPSRCGRGTTCASAGRDFDLVQDNQCLGYGLLGHRAARPARARPRSITRSPSTAASRWSTPRRRASASRCGAGTRSRRCRPGWRRRLERVVTVSQNSSRTTSVPDHGVDARAHARRAGRRRPGAVPPAPGVERVPGRLITTASRRRHDEGPALPARGAWPSCAPSATIELVVIGRLKEGGRRPRPSTSSASRDVVTFVTGVPEERIIELYSEAELAVVPSLYEGFSLPAIEAMSCGVPLVATTGGALPEVVGADGDTALLVAPGRQRGAGRQDPHGARRPRAAGRGRRRRPAAGHRPLDLAPHRRAARVEQYRALLPADAGPRPLARGADAITGDRS